VVKKDLYHRCARTVAVAALPSPPLLIPAVSTTLSAAANPCRIVKTLSLAQKLSLGLALSLAVKLLLSLVLTVYVLCRST
ncbi:hypothetical protein A2U01_0064260, partial [Trifolium medium]|nr:hypothetical protein [Trifolium medium]